MVTSKVLVDTRTYDRWNVSSVALFEMRILIEGRGPLAPIEALFLVLSPWQRVVL